MAINVKLTKDVESESKDLITYAIYEFPGLTSAGTRFIFDAEATGLTSWYLFDESLNQYVAYSGDPNSEYINTLPVESPTANSISLFNYYVNNLLNSTAISYGYDSIDNAVSYYNSGITSWRDEAIAFNTWRDNTVSLMYDNIFSFTADGITLPSLTSGGFTGQTGYFDIGITASRPQLFG